MTDLYLQDYEIEMLKEEIKKLEEEKDIIYKKACNILEKNNNENNLIYKKFIVLLNSIHNDTCDNYMWPSIDEILKELSEEKIFREDDFNNLSQIIRKLNTKSSDIRRYKNIIKLPSIVKFNNILEEEKKKYIDEAKKDELQNPTNLSDFTNLLSNSFDITIPPYTNLLLFIRALPFSLDPKDPRYISLSNRPLIHGKGTNNLIHFKVEGIHKLTAQGTDIIKEMREWNEYGKASILMKGYLAFQQYLEKDISGFNQSINELNQETKLEVQTDMIFNNAKKVLESDGMEKIYALANFKKFMENQYGHRPRFESDVMLWISTIFKKNYDVSCEQTPNPMTKLEKAIIHSESKDFYNQTLYNTQKVSFLSADNMLEEIKKQRHF